MTLSSVTKPVVSAEVAREVASTIKKQAGVWGLAAVGASNFLFNQVGMGALRFTGRLHFVGSLQPRKMAVDVVLNGADLYDVVVTRPDFTEVTFARDVSASELTATLYRLDSEGVPKLSKPGGSI